MTLLSRAIGSSGQGLGYLDKMIEKSELEDQKLEANIDQYNTMAGGVKSAATYMGKTSRGILNEYARAFETAIDNFAADPSADNERVIEQIRLQTQDFYNRASATRQNSMANLNAVRANPENYSVSVAKAQQMFSDLEDNDMSARFDLDSMTMYVGDGQSQVQIGDAGYYNGSQPLVYDKAAQLGAIKAEGSWGSSHLDQFMGMVGTEDGKDRIIEAFMETARPTGSAYQETAIYNYLQDIKNLDLTQIESEVELRERILEVRNNSSELTAALQHMGELEYNYMRGAAAAKRITAQQQIFNELFRGDVDTRTDISESGEDPYVLTQTGETGAATRYSDPFAGVTGVRMLEKPLTAESGEGGLAGVSDFGDVLVGYDVDALGRIVVEVEKKVVDPDDEENETMIREFHVLDDESGDLYRNLRADLKGKGIFGLLQEQSIARKMYREKSANDRAIAEAYANSDLEPTLPEHRLTTTPEEVRAATGPSLRQTQSERNREQRREEFNEVSTVEKQSVIALAGLPKNIRQSYYSEEDKNSFGNYNIPKGATMKGNNVVVNGEEVGKLVTQRSSETGKYETRGMVPIQKNAIQRFFQGVGRFFGPSDSNVEEYLDAKQKIETEDTPIGPVDNSREILNRAESDRLFGGNFTGGLQASEIAVSDRQDDDQKQNFTTTLVDLGRKNGVVFPEVMASQSVLESGWGTSESAPNNVFGIKYSASLLKDLEEKGIKAFRGSEVSTQEEEGGELREIQTNFMGFESLEDAVKAYKYLIESRSAYKEAREAENALDFVRALQGTYATDSQYAEKIQSIAADSLGVDLSQIERQF